MKNPWKITTLILLLYPLLIAISFALLSFVSLRHYQTFIGATDYQSIYDWDYPASAIGDFNNDGKQDEITSGGCAYFDTNISTSRGIMCDPYYSENKPMDQVKNPYGYPYHSYLIKENNLWTIIVLDKNFNLSRYEIQENASIQKKPATFIDFIRELIYMIPVFLLYALILPLSYLSTLIGKWLIFLYLGGLIISSYMWYQTKKKKISKKVFIIPLLALLILAVGFFYWGKPSTDFQEKMQSSNWIERKDEQVGYSFEVPDFWIYQTDSYTQFNATYSVSASAFDQLSYFDIFFYKNPPKGRSDELVNFHKYRLGTTVKDKIETKNINGVAFTQITELQKSAYRKLIYLIPPEKDLIIAVKTSYPENVVPLSEEEENKVVDRMINSIRKI